MFRYQKCYHSFLPIVRILDFANLEQFARQQPHLFTAILTIASRDEESKAHVHATCHDHMQSLISATLAGSEAGIEAVEALLLLAEWVSHRPQGHNPVGRGEEDRVAWMYIGTALRLGYFLDLDRAAFSRGPPGDLTVELIRRRLVWIGR